MEEHARGEGVGSGLLRFVLDAADAAGIREVWGVVTSEDLERWPGLLDWYRRHGFAVSDPDPDSDLEAGEPTPAKMIYRRR